MTCILLLQLCHESLIYIVIARTSSCMCIIIYVGLIQSFFTIKTQDTKFNSQKLSLTPVSFFSSYVLPMLLGTLCETVMTRLPIPLLGLSGFTFLVMLSHSSGKLYLPPSLLRLGFRALMYMTSFTPLWNHADSQNPILSLVFLCFLTRRNVGDNGRGCVLQPLRW